jgi:hypothetical protein
MKILFFSLSLMLSIAGLSFAADQPAPVYEMRTYYAAPGKFDALQARFRDHTVKLFEKHGITNVGYWLPVENADSRLIYLLSYPSREARETSWKAFMADPAWVAAKTASEKDGKLLTKVEALFLTATDYSPKPVIEAKSPARQFELRIYTTNEGKLPNLDARFRDHTMKLFEKHGMTNVVYLHPMPDQPGAANTLVYLLAHRDDAARTESFKSFGADPAWQAVRKASEEAGPILIKGGVKSVPMTAADFSPMK